MLDLRETKSEKIPLHSDPDGTVRVGGTRVTLDVLMEAYDQGATPEQIAQKFGELRLDDVYAVVTYYLRHPKDIREYIASRDREAEVLRLEVEALPQNREFRERLLRLKRDRS